MCKHYQGYCLKMNISNFFKNGQLRKIFTVNNIFNFVARVNKLSHASLKGKNGVTFFVGLLLAIALPLMYINRQIVAIITGG